MLVVDEYPQAAYAAIHGSDPGGVSTRRLHDRVVAVQRLTEIEPGCAVGYTVRGKIVRGREYMTREQALEPERGEWTMPQEDVEVIRRTSRPSRSWRSRERFRRA